MTATDKCGPDSWHTRLAYVADRHFAKLALGPIIGLLTIAAVVPFAIMLALSFTDFSFNLPGHDGGFVGFANYLRAVLEDQRFHESLKLQTIFLACTLPVEFVMGLWISIGLWRSGAVSKQVLPLLAIPMLLAPVTVGMIWRLLLHGDYGPIGYYVTRMPALQIDSILGSPTTAFLAVAFVDIWQWTPFFAIVLLAGLHSLPQEPFQAAMVDGASRSRVLWTLTIPLLRPAITVALLIRFMDSFKEFDKIFVLTRGGPASATELVSVYTWIVSFEHGELSYGSAVTILIYLMIYVACVGLFWTARKDWRQRGAN
jgi:multiple sugar transport system permease protein